MRPIAVNVLSGVGGFALGVEQAGFNVVAAFEPDRASAYPLAHNMPLTAINTDDIRGISPSKIGRTVREGLAHFRCRPWTDTDLAFGGPLPVVNALGQAPALYQREMLAAFGRAAMTVKPRCMLLALETATMPDPADLRAFYNLLGEHGYRAEPPRALDTSWFGVPQRRSFTFVLAARADVALPPLATATTMPNDHLTLPLFEGLACGPTTNDAFSDLDVLDGIKVNLARTDRVEIGVAELRLMERYATPYARELRARGLTDFSHEREWDDSVLFNVRIENEALDTMLRYSRTPSGAIEAMSGYARLDERDAAPSLGPRVLGQTHTPLIHPRIPRKITAREAARLQSLLDWFRINVTREQEMMQVANSVPPILAREISGIVLRHLGYIPVSPTRRLAPPTRRALGMIAAA